MFPVVHLLIIIVINQWLTDLLQCISASHTLNSAFQLERNSCLEVSAYFSLSPPLMVRGFGLRAAAVPQPSGFWSGII